MWDPLPAPRILRARSIQVQANTRKILTASIGVSITMQSLNCEAEKDVSVLLAKPWIGIKRLKQGVLR